MGELIFWFFCFGLALAAGISGYHWRQRVPSLSRRWGGFLMIIWPLAPVVLVLIFAKFSGSEHPWHEAPHAGVSTFDAIPIFLSVLFPFWSFGFLGGYLFGSASVRGKII